MPFDLIEKFKQALPGWKTRMKQSGVTSAYAVITASALWPMVAAAQAGDASGALALATALGGSVAAKLFADQIRKWKDEADGARQIAALPKDNPARECLDALLLRLDAFTAARDALPTSERQWFQQTLREEFTRLGNLNKFEGQIGKISAKNVQINTGTIKKQINRFS
jgi:hypothetical protein